MADTLFADVSEFQAPVNDSYTGAGFRFLSFRSNDGGHRDANFYKNYAWAAKAADEGRITGFIVYFYWRVGSTDVDTHIDMVTRAGGPHPKMVTMIDLESGGNPIGDQSAELNGEYNRLAGWLGNPTRVIAYANRGDYGMWRSHPAELRWVGAGYGQDPKLPNQIAHQYTDGNGYGHGLPEGAAPFGNCDMNSADGLSPEQLAAALGIGTAAPAPNAIDEAYKAAPWLGAKLTKEVELTTPDGRGRFAQYEHGYIYWTPTTGARPIPTNLFEPWAKRGYEKGPLGYPTRFFTVIPKTGDVQAFEGGVLYRKYGQPDGFYVRGAIGDRFARTGFESGPLGWPTSDEVKFNGGVYQDFEHGRLIWAPDGVVAVPPGAAPITTQ